MVFISYFFLEKRVMEIKKFNLKTIIFFVILILYSTTWHMPHSCQKNLGKGIESFKDRIFFRINNPTNYNDLSRKIILKLLRVNEHK